MEYVPDRLANDARYSMDWTKIGQLGYQPVRTVEDGLAETVEWYRANTDRWAPLLRRSDALMAVIALATPAGASHAG